MKRILEVLILMAALTVIATACEVETTEIRDYGYARYLIDDNTNSGKFGLASGWTYNNKYQNNNNAGTDSTQLEASSNGEVAFLRKIKKVDRGTFEFNTNIHMSSTVKNGFYIALENDSYENIVKIFIDNGKFAVQCGENDCFTSEINGVTARNQTHTFVVCADIDNKIVTVYIDGGKVCSQALTDSFNFARVKIGFEKGGTGTIKFLNARAFSNYAVNDTFPLNDGCIGTAPYEEWENCGNVKLYKLLSEKGEDVYSAKITASAGTDTYSLRKFDSIGGKVVFEASVLLPRGSDGAYVSAEYNGQSVLKVSSESGSFINGSMKRSFTENVWQFIRIEADTSTGKAVFKLNGKVFADSTFDSDGFDAIKIGIASNENAVMWFDDVKVYSIYESEDYPSEPKSVNRNDGYNIGVNVCNLWRNGYHAEGWDVVSPFSELTPYLGYYDEGLPEVADWEIKWMAEHSIDFQHVCWYAPSSNISAPIKAKSMEQTALDDGYMNAKYSDYVDFCIMWENSTVNVNNIEDFKKYLWPYFKDHYFSDKRYVRLDNKALLTVWSINNFITTFGGVEGAGAAIAFMRDDIKSLGYDGIVIWFADGGGSVKDELLEKAASIGADAIYAYNFNTSGSSDQHQIQMLENAKNQRISYYVPTVSVGFNMIARHDRRFPLITQEAHKKVCEYIKDDYLTSVKSGTWKDNTLIISTWNEYSEGTYVAPTESNGFGYLDNIRDTYSKTDSLHQDEVPSETALERICNIYPSRHDPLRIYRNNNSFLTEAVNGDTIYQYDFSQPESRKEWTVLFGIRDFTETNNSIKGTGYQGDFAVSTKNANTESVNIPAGENTVLHIRMKTDILSSSEFYFITNEDTKWDDSKRLVFTHTKAGEFVDYYIRLSACAKWVGTLKAIRLDPMIVPGEFEIQLIELINAEKADIYSVSFDGNLMSFDFSPVYDGNLKDVLVTANPRKGFFSMLHAYYEYSRIDKTLMIESCEKTILFTIDSNVAIIDGKEQMLDFTLVLRDGLPVFPIKRLAELLGYGYSENGKTIDVLCNGK